jgi:hypothetical protein
MTIDLTKLSDRRLQGLFRVAKTRAKAFFRDPYAMILLRAEMRRRGLCR